MILPENLGVSGVVLADQIKSLDWKARQANFIAQAPPAIIDQVATRVKMLLLCDNLVKKSTP